MRRILLAAALTVAGFAGGSDAVCAGSVLCAGESGCYGLANVCPDADYCSGTVNVCPGAEECRGGVNVCDLRATATR